MKENQQAAVEKSLPGVQARCAVFSPQQMPFLVNQDFCLLQLVDATHKHPRHRQPRQLSEILPKGVFCMIPTVYNTFIPKVGRKMFLPNYNRNSCFAKSSNTSSIYLQLYSGTKTTITKGCNLLR